MEIPAPLMNGSMMYLMLTLLTCFTGIGMGVTGKMSRENSSIGNTLLRYWLGESDPAGGKCEIRQLMVFLADKSK
ncbi:hypothetical protein KXD40_005691 [Peronospora effusa]|uniref:Uncharacterized protein n=1 Tax=Peronospora effusa TaxID=542832 RepID=A0A3M6VFA7_9STRA|nr:hypothetical protein DD238_004425 [Peronospora effusa]RQM13817.1 hypothetical protein DD237_004858 [Peronospora effusa]UIZ27738.1 hypothetical protein KXD40_005691 [Peronospora effusa]